MYHGGNFEFYEEIVILLTYAVIKPFAMMIETRSTTVTLTAMLSFFILYVRVTNLTQELPF